MSYAHSYLRLFNICTQAWHTWASNEAQKALFKMATALLRCLSDHGSNYGVLQNIAAGLGLFVLFLLKILEKKMSSNLPEKK